MNDRPSSAEQRLAAWLSEGPTSGPDELLVAAHARARTIRQRPARWLAWRGRTMDTTWRARPLPGMGRLWFASLLLLTAALLGVAIVAGSRLLPAPLPLLEVAAVIPQGGDALIAYTSWNTDGTDLFVARADGTEVHRLTDDAEIDTSPAWSPDGGRIAFLHGSAERMDLFVIGAGGTISRIASDVGCYPSQLGPTWSPDGRFVLYMVDRDRTDADCGDTTLDLFVVAADGSGRPHRLLRSDLAIMSDTPDWSADGRTIVFRGGTDGVTDVWAATVADADAPWDLAARPVTTDGAMVEAGSHWWPRLSPDGTRVASTVWPADGGVTSVVVTPIDGGPAWTVPTLGARGSAVAEWVDDRHLVYLAADTAGSGPVVTREVGVDGEPMIIEGPVAQLDTRLAISPDGTLVAMRDFDRANPGDLLIAPLDDDPATGAESVVRLNAVMWATSSWQPVVNEDNPTVGAPVAGPGF